MGAMTAMITKTGVKKNKLLCILKGKRCLWSVKFAHRVANVAIGSKKETKTDRKAAQLLSNLIGIQNMNRLDGLDGSKMGNDKNYSVTRSNDRTTACPHLGSWASFAKETK
jgi:hypothetical protein